MSAPRRLDLDRGEDVTIRPLEPMPWVLYRVLHLDTIGDDRKEIFLDIPLQVLICKLQQAFNIYVDDVDVVGGEILFYLLHELGDDAPLCDILSFELCVL